MMCKLKGWMDKGGHYHVEIKWWIQNVALICANLKGGWIRVGTMMCKLKGGCKKCPL